MNFKVATLSSLALFCLVAVTEAASIRMGKASSGLYLHTYEAGVANARRGGKLEDGSAICPTKYPGGFTIACSGVSKEAKLVYLSYNGTTKTEKVAPYTLAGDNGGNAKPFRSHGKGGVLKCWTDLGDSVEVEVSFTCDGPAPAPAASDEKPTDAVQKPPAPAADPEPRPPASTPKPAAPKPTKAPPSDEPAKQEEKPKPPQPRTAPAASTANGGNCVVVDALKDASHLPDGWVATRNGGIIFHPGGGHTIEKQPASSDKDYITYKFRSPIDGTLGFAMDSISTHRSEANDVFIQMTNPPFFLYGKGDRTPISKPFKVFQDSAGRDERLWARGDVHLPGFGHRNGDTVQTGKLNKGQVYSFRITGRSHDFTILHFVLWPCSGKTCKMSHPEWREMANKCRPF